MGIWRWLFGFVEAPLPRAVPASLSVETEFLGRPALAARIVEQRALIGYVDRDGQSTLRAVTFDEVLDQNGHRYLSGYCHERFDRRHFRLDRITAMHRYDSGAPVDPAREVARWLGHA